MLGREKGIPIFCCLKRVDYSRRRSRDTKYYVETLKVEWRWKEMEKGFELRWNLSLSVYFYNLRRWKSEVGHEVELKNCFLLTNNSQEVWVVKIILSLEYIYQSFWTLCFEFLKNLYFQKSAHVRSPRRSSLNFLA